MKLKLSLFVLMIVMQLLIKNAIHGQNRGPNEFKYENGHCLKEVHFGGTANTNYIIIRKDNNSDNYSAPHFVKEYPNECSIGQTGNVTTKNPVAYVSGSTPKVKAKFVSYCTKPYWIRGVGPLINGVSMFFEKQQVTPNNFEAIYEWQESSTSFSASTVKYFEKFVIKWQISKDGNGSWLDIGQSENPLYVTLKAPEVPSIVKGYDHFHTLLKVSCQAADGYTTDNTVITSIWNKIKTKKIVTADSNSPLTYYANWVTCNSLNTLQLLNTKDGQCGSWARFYIDLLKIHSVNHISVEDDFFQFSPLVGYAHGFLVNNWIPNPGIYFRPLDVFSYLMIPKQKPGDDWWKTEFCAGNKYNFHYSDLIDDINSIEGQGVIKNPESIFGNHQISQINGILHDPSYGSEYQSLNNLETNSLFGYFFLTQDVKNEVTFDPDGDGVPNPTDLNGDGNISESAETWVILISADKTVAELERKENSQTNH